MVMKKLVLLLFATQLYACGSPTPYTAATEAREYGYTESRLTDDRYRVSFRGSPETTSDEVKDMALLRAAEVTLINDYDWFRVVTQETSETSSLTPTTITREPVQQVHRDCGPLGCTTTVTPGYTGTQVITTEDLGRYATSIEIVMGRGELVDPTVAYNAVELRNTLGRRY
jgi:hypothetical protein